MVSILQDTSKDVLHDGASGSSSNTNSSKRYRYRWTVDQLERKVVYSSSRDLQRDIHQMGPLRQRQSEKNFDSYTPSYSSSVPKIFTLTSSNSKINGKERNKKRSYISKDGSIRKYRRKTSKSTSIRPTRTEIADLATVSKATIDPSPSSVDWRLGELVLTASLGDHLLLAGRKSVEQIIYLFCGFDYPESWNSFQDLKTRNKTSISTSEILDIWVYSTLAAGAIVSWHSGIIGQAALTDAPRQKFRDSLLDLRSCGIAKEEAVYSLLNRCFFTTLEASIMKEPSEKSLEVIGLLLALFCRFTKVTSLFGLLKLAISHYKHLNKMIKDRKERNAFAEKFFETVFVFDIMFHSEVECCGPPFLSISEIQEMLHDSDVEPMNYVDPNAFFTSPFPKDPHQLTDMYWKQGKSILHRLCVQRELANRDNASQISMETACSKLVIIQQMIRQSRETVFTRMTPRTTPNKVYQRSVLGPEHIVHSRSLRADESISVFILYKLSKNLLKRFNTSSKFFTLCRQLEEMTDQQIKLNLELSEFILDDLEESDAPIFESGFMAHAGLIHSFSHLPDGWRYLAKWRQRHPEYTPIIYRVVRVCKYISFRRAEFVQHIAEYEDEEQIFSLQADEPALETIPSPNLSDFQRTLSC